MDLYFDEATNEYQREIELELEKNIRIIDELKRKVEKKSISHDVVLGVIPYIKSSPKHDFFLYSEIKVRTKDEPILKYLPYSSRYDRKLELLDFEDTSIFDTPWNKEYEILVRVIIKCIIVYNGNISSILRRISDFLGVKNSELNFIFNELMESQKNRCYISLMRMIDSKKEVSCPYAADDQKSNLTQVMELIRISEKRYVKATEVLDFCKVCFLFGCDMHKIKGRKSFKTTKGKKTYVDISSIGEYGLFAGEEINKNDFVIEYTGEIITNSEGERRGYFCDLKGSSYLFLYVDENTIDAKRIGNNGRFINHSKKGNLFSRILTSTEGKKICFFAERNIKKDEELLFNYKYSLKHKKLYGIKD